MQISHFSSAEVTRSMTAFRYQLNNALPPELRGNVTTAAAGMESVRTILGHREIQVLSWYRCLELNTLVRGSKNSAHIKGYAVDFICPKFGSPLRIVQEIATASTNLNLKFDQCIQEGDWVHISFAPTLRGEILTAHFDSTGKATYSKGLV
jgi:hypothetical protein